MDEKVFNAGRRAGLLLGVILALIMFVIAVSAIANSDSFYIKAEDTLSLTEAMDLKNVDQYITVYHAVGDMTRGRGFADKNVYAADGSVQKAFNAPEAERMKTINTAMIVIRVGLVVLLLLAGWLVAHTVLKYHRECLLPTGFFAVTGAILCGAALVISLILVNGEWGWQLLTACGGRISLLVSPAFAKMFAKDLMKIYLFIMLIPLVVGVILINLSTKRVGDVSDDYLYQ